MKALIEVFPFQELSREAKAKVIETYGRDVINSYNWNAVFEPFIEKSKALGVVTLLYDVSRNSSHVIIYGVVDRKLAYEAMKIGGTEPEIPARGRMLFVEEDPGAITTYISYECDSNEDLTTAIIQSLSSLAQAMQTTLQGRVKSILTPEGMEDFFTDLDAKFLPDGTWLKVESKTFLPVH